MFHLCANGQQILHPFRVPIKALDKIDRHHFVAQPHQAQWQVMRSIHLNQIHFQIPHLRFHYAHPLLEYER